jgi:hypothetical protein
MATPLSPLRALRVCAMLLLGTGAAVAQQARAPAPQAPAPAGAQRVVPLLGDQTDGSRARPVHAIPLRDVEGEVIRPTDRPLVPFSPVRTCGADCHDVATVARGWHFNTTDPTRDNGRRGEPWILVDLETATQVPSSYRPRAGAFSPEQVGLTPWTFAVTFGGRTPGGLGDARERNPELQARWVVSGELDINCLACHDASPAYDHAEYGRQLRLENFRWAPASASGLAAITGSAKEMPNSFDYLLPSVEDALLPRMPTVTYSRERFLPGAKVVFDIERQVLARRCYFCHSSADLAHTGQGRWNADEDIHLARGMTCVDCHRNGLDHAMNRGYEGETSANGSAIAALTCRGCHLATEPERNFARGRLGAPYPKHVGIPSIHFTKLSCTACHSGPRPEKTTRGLKTSQAHRLGALGVNKARDVLPHLYYPVFAQQPDGQTIPNRLLWPAFWGRMSNGAVEPIAPDRVKALMAKAKFALTPSVDGDWPALDEVTLVAILRLLQAEPQAEGTPVYVAGGRLHKLDASGRVASEDHRSAQPYLWPIAHDVRPAALALGARGCSDCHNAESPIFFGNVSVDSPLASDRAVPWKMSRFQKSLDTTYVADLARSFQYRPWFKAGASAAAAILLLFVLAYATSGLRRVSAATGGARWTRVVVNVFGVASCAAGVASGWQALFSGQRLAGYPLMVHVAMAPALLAGAVLVTLFWAQENAFTRADWTGVRHPAGGADAGGARAWLVVLRKICFWIAMVAVIPATSSATLVMFPVLASVRQDALFLAHRYSVVPLAVAATLFAGLALATWLMPVVARRSENQ